MRTRRRPVLQDKTPGNTPQKPKSKATSTKSRLVPVVEIKARVRRSSRGKHVEEAVPVDTVDVTRDEDSEVAREIVISPDHRIVKERRQNDNRVPRQTARARRGEPRKGKEKKAQSGEVGIAPTAAQNIGAVPRKRVGHEDIGFGTEGRRGREKKSAHTEPPPPPTRREVVDEGVEDTHDAAYDVDLDVPIAEDDYPTDDVQNFRTLPSPVSPSGPKAHSRPPLGSLPPSSFPVIHSPRTPEPIPSAEESTASDAVRAILNTPSPARIIRTPMPVQSTPLGRLPSLIQSVHPFHARGRHDSSIQKWNASVEHAYSPLPPSSPLPQSPPTRLPLASSSQPRNQAHRFFDELDEDQKNPVVSGAVYAKKERMSDDDPFGLLAVEQKLKTIRQHRIGVESSRAHGGKRAPLGTLALDEVPSHVAVPDRLPTPLPSDDDHNIDDLYLDVDPVRPELLHYEDHDEDLDKENVLADGFDLDANKENLPPSDPDVDDSKENNLPGADVPMEDDFDDKVNQTTTSIAPFLLASAKKGLDEILESSSSSASPSHALRTPHKHRSAHRRSPLPTPHFSEGGFSDSPFTAAKSTGMRNSSPSPIKPSISHPSAQVGRPPKPMRQPLATLEVEVEEPEPPKVAGKKRTRAQIQVEESSEESDPRAAVRKLEALLPTRSKKARTTAQLRGGRGKGRTATSARGRGRENEPKNMAEDETDSSPPRAPIRATRGRGRGRSITRGRGRAAAVASTGRPTTARGRSGSRGRPVSKGKGKEKATEEVDPEQDEERTRQRQERIEYFRKLKEYSLEKEDIYVI